MQFLPQLGFSIFHSCSSHPSFGRVGKKKQVREPYQDPLSETCLCKDGMVHVEPEDAVRDVVESFPLRLCRLRQHVGRLAGRRLDGARRAVLALLRQPHHRLQNRALHLKVSSDSMPRCWRVHTGSGVASLSTPISQHTWMEVLQFVWFCVPLQSRRAHVCSTKQTVCTHADWTACTAQANKIHTQNVKFSVTRHQNVAPNPVKHK